MKEIIEQLDRIESQQLELMQRMETLEASIDVCGIDGGCVLLDILNYLELHVKYCEKFEKIEIEPLDECVEIRCNCNAAEARYVYAGGRELFFPSEQHRRLFYKTIEKLELKHGATPKDLLERIRALENITSIGTLEL